MDVDINLLDLPSKVLWLGGIVSSTLCVIIQLLLYIVLPSTRKPDQMILTQLAVARIGKELDNYVMITLELTDLKVICSHVTLGLNLLTDAAITFWMFIFTKNLYDKLVQVFTLKETNFTVLSVCVWLVTIPIGVVCPVFLSIDFKYCNAFYLTFVIVKLSILFVNFLLFCRIFWVIINLKADRDLPRLFKTCVISLILLLITSLQAILEVVTVDLSTYFLLWLKYKDYGYLFNVVNAYQVLAMTAIFIILSRDPDTQSMKKKILAKLNITV